MSSDNLVHLLMGPGYSFETVPGSDLEALQDDLLMNRINSGAYFDTVLIAPGYGLFLVQPPQDGIHRGVYYPNIDCSSKDSTLTAATLAYLAGAGMHFPISVIGEQILHMIGSGFQYLRIIDIGTSDCRFWESGRFDFE